MFVFQNHEVFPGGLFIDLYLSLFPVLFFLLLQKGNNLPKIGKNMKMRDFFLVYCFILFIPNSTYAFFEMKHVIFSSLTSVLVFGSVSFVGLVCTLLGNFLIAHHYAKNKTEMIVYYLFLSLIDGFGAVVGLMDYSSVIGFIPFFFPIIWVELIKNIPLILLGLVTSSLIFILGYSTHRLYFKPSV